MQLWFSRQSDISIREQLATQVVLGILSGELAPGQRLPSTREIARRFHLHPNTVSAGYRQLERGNWVEFRKGSGVYVGTRKPSAPGNGLELDQLIADFFRSARRLNATLAEVRSRLRRWLDLQPPDHFLLIEPDGQLARIILHEIQKTVTFPVQSCGADEFNSGGFADGAVLVTVSISAKSVRQLLPENVDVLTLHLSSAGASLAEHLPLPELHWSGLRPGGRRS